MPPVPRLDVFTSCNSGVTVTVAVPQSLAVETWAVGVATQAWFVSVDGSAVGVLATVAFTTIGAPTEPLAGIGSVPVKVHATLLADDALQSQPVAVIGSTADRPAGIGSLTVMAPLSNGPLADTFRTTRLKDTGSPAFAWVGVAVLVIARSGATTSVLLTLEVRGAPIREGAEKLKLLLYTLPTALPAGCNGSLMANTWLAGSIRVSGAGAA